MGGGHYEGDVSYRSRSTRREVFTYEGYSGGDSKAASKAPERRECHKDLNIKGKIRECRDSAEHPNTTPIVIVMDVTRSRGDDAKVIYEKMPMFIGQMIMKGIVSDPVLCVAAVGDASSGDQAPIQVGQFESDNRIDENLAKIWLEGKGGGTGQESYELAAYYFATKTYLDANTRGKKGYLFFLGDEGFYLEARKDQMKVWIGDDCAYYIPSSIVFESLQQKYNVFFIYQQKEWEERKKDIDEEIKGRVERAGGMYENVDIRASLLWNNKNDLDLHVVDPCGHHIFYGSYCKSNHREAASCGGFLDVDMNVKGETTKPVENIRWEKGRAPKGHYLVYVQCYAFHEHNNKGTEFRVEIQTGEEILHFEGRTPDGLSGQSSDTDVYEFDYDPERIVTKNKADKYAAYDENVIKNQWASVIPPENVLVCEDPRGIIDIMLGAISLMEEKNDLNNYLVDMKGRDQTDLRIRQTEKSLSELALSVSQKTDKVDIEKIDLPKGNLKSRKSKSSRL